jgi:hypothetical protein
LYHFENSAIVAEKSDIVTFIRVKPIKVTSGFNLRRINTNPPDGTDMQKNQKQIFKILHLKIKSKSILLKAVSHAQVGFDVKDCWNKKAKIAYLLPTWMSHFWKKDVIGAA